ncbi:hypothetical protein [Kordiimonas sp.]|uniref:hypothetical protein n=1 Tax=Kordiimonas sp. TaxID=1970157 RepID=UPI003A93A7B3
MMVRLVLIGMMLVLAACASGGSGPNARVETPETASMSRLGSDEVLSHISALPAQVLSAGECGLFLWLKRDDAPLIFFQRSKSETAQMIIDGAPRSLARTEVAGPIGMSFFERQGFTAEDMTVNLRMQVMMDQSLQGGLKVPSGIISIDRTDGWSAALPVAGAIGCK